MALNMQTRAVQARPSNSLAGWGRAGAARTRSIVTCNMSRQQQDKVNRKPGAAASMALRKPPAMPLQATGNDKELEVGLEGEQAAAKLAIPARYQLLMATGLSFVLCNMDKVNMSVAIIPMAMDNGWSPSVSGTVQAAFFYGYMLSQLPGGYLASTVGGRKVLPGGVALWSAATCVVPLLAGTVPGLCVARAGVGLGEAVAPSAAIDMVSRVVPPAERSRAVAFIFAGLHIGSITGLLAAPALINWLGWQSVFVVFGGAGLVWVAWYESVVRGLCRADPDFAAQLAHGYNHSAAASAELAAAPAEEGSSSGDHHAGVIDANMTIPYRAFLRSRPVQALCFTHFCHNWLHYTMLSWLPFYFTSTLSVDLLHAAQTALFPPLAGIVASATAGPLADGLLARGVPVSKARKLVQGASFMGPMVFLLAACNDQVQDSRTLTVACITLALGMSSLSLGGLYCTHSDMSPRYASALLGLTNTVGAIPGIIGVATVGYLYDTTHSWDAALFMPSVVCMAAGCLVYTLFARNHPIDFDAMDNSPFAFEQYLPRLPSWLSQRLPWSKQQQVEVEETPGAKDNNKKLD